MLRRTLPRIMLVAVAVFSILAVSNVLFAQGLSQEAFERVREVQERHTEKLMEVKGVEGTAVGVNQQGHPVVKVFVERAGVAGIPKKLDDLPVQVVATGKFYARAASNWFERPVPIGVSTGHPNITAGTIGCRVTDGTDVYALSNNHVYADANNASIGDNVLQPGDIDGGTDPADAIGTLHAFEPIVFSRRARNTIDAAIALTDSSLVGTATPAGGYGTPSSAIVGAEIGQQVQKFGRTTELTTGEVTGVNATLLVGYGSGKTARFVKQIIIEPGGFSAPGDSGSLIVTQSGNNPVGLLFAGSDTHTVANRIDLVLDRFNVTVDGEEPTANDAPIVSIESPSDGSTFGSGDYIDFRGTASDTEDGDLTATMVWTSSIDGEIGTGGIVSAILSDGTHTITASVTDSGGKSATDSISITVGTPQTPLALYVDVATDAPSYLIGEWAYITVTVTDDIGGVESASVHTVVTTASNRTYSGDGTTASNGTVKFKFKPKKPDGKGTYTVTADASKSGYDPGSGSTTFEVK